MKPFSTTFAYFLQTKRKALQVVLVAVALFLFAGAPVKNNEILTDAHSIIYGMFKSIDNVKTLQYLMVSSERIDDGKIHNDSNHVKSQKSPHKIYMKTSNGDEILWADGSNNGNAWVHPNSFPFITLPLDPDGAILRKGEHHGVQYAGYDYFAAVLKQAADKSGKNFDAHFLYLGDITYDGAKCYNIIAMDKDYSYFSYKVQKGENLLTIAKKFWVNEYMLMQHNKLNSLNDVSAGQTIMIPTDYGKLITLYIDKKTMLPHLLRVDDEKGLFEQYVFKHIVIDPALTNNDFSKDNKEYHF